MAGVADQHGVIQLLVRDGQLQMTTVFTEHISTVPDDGESTQKLNCLTATPSSGTKIVFYKLK